MSEQSRGIREDLTEFGFSDKEVDTYLAIVESGEAKATDIAEEAGVSKRYVYNVLSTFEERGLVEVNDHAVPTTIAAVPPDEAVGRMADRLQSIESKLESRYDRVPDELGEFEVIKSRSTITKRISQLLADATTEVTVSIPEATFSLVREELADAVSRGVLVLVQINSYSGSLDYADIRGTGTVVRTWEEDGPMLMTVDRQYGLFSPAEVLAGSHSDRQGIGFTEGRLAPILVGSFLGNYWPAAREQYVETPFELPHTYDRFRHAVFDATMYQRNGVSLEATLEVRPAGSDAPFESRSGTIAEVRQGMIEPLENTIPIEHAFVVEDGDERFTVGGLGAFKEEYEAQRVRLEAADDDPVSVSEMLDRSARLAADDQSDA